jgi:hypothetical protein
MDSDDDENRVKAWGKPSTALYQEIAPQVEEFSIT